MGCKVTKNSKVDKEPSENENPAEEGTSDEKPAGKLPKGVEGRTTRLSHQPITPYNQLSYSQTVYDHHPQIPLGPQIKLIYFDYDGTAEVTR